MSRLESSVEGPLAHGRGSTLAPVGARTRSRERVEAERLSELLDVAAEVFIADGFESASTNEIARRANASKTTFYSRFPTKEILFSTVMEYRMGQVFDRIAPSLPSGAPLGEALHGFGMSILRASLSPLQIGLIRMISMESKRFPELGRRFYELGAGRGKALLAEYLAEQAARGALRSDDPGIDPEIMAEHLISLIIGGPVHWYVLGFSTTMPEGEARERHVHAAVTAFLRAYGAGKDTLANVSGPGQHGGS